MPLQINDVLSTIQGMLGDNLQGFESAKAAIKRDEQDKENFFELCLTLAKDGWTDSFDSSLANSTFKNNDDTLLFL